MVTNPNAQGSETFLSSFNIQDSAKKEVDGKVLWTATQAREDGETDGLTPGDETVVRKNMADGYDNVWIYNEADGYWYYYRTLEAGEATEIDLLDSLSIASNIDLGHYVQSDFYYVSSEEIDKTEITDWKEYKYLPAGSTRVVIPNPDWEEGMDEADKMIMSDGPAINIENSFYGDQNNDGLLDAIDLALILQDRGEMAKTDNLYRRNESKLDKDLLGYADANYTLTITSQFVQATPDAVAEAFPEAPKAIKNMFVDYDLDSNEQNRLVNPIEP